MSTRIKHDRMDNSELQARMAKILFEHQEGELTAGTLLRTLRRNFLGKTQEEFAQAVKVSRRTLIQIESDNFGSVSFEKVERVFRPFGIHWRAAPLPNRTTIKTLMKGMPGDA